MRHTTSPRTFSEVLIAQLGPHHRDRVLRHLQALPAHDLWLRFGYVMTDEALRLYVRRLHFSRDALFGIFDQAAELLAFGHLGCEKGADSKTAEFGISVLPRARRHGLALRLLQRAAVHARNRGASTLMMTYVAGNEALIELARRAGMHFVAAAEEPRAYLTLEPPTPASLINETFAEMLAAVDLGFRVANADYAAQRRAPAALTSA